MRESQGLYIINRAYRAVVVKAMTFTDIITRVEYMSWVSYMIMAAQHSKGNAAHWFRYLRKYIEKCGTVFTMDDVESLYSNEALSPFQRVTIKAAFEDGSPTRQHIVNLNSTANLKKIQLLREKYWRRSDHLFRRVLLTA